MQFSLKEVSSFLCLASCKQDFYFLIDRQFGFIWLALVWRNHSDSQLRNFFYKKTPKSTNYFNWVIRPLYIVLDSDLASRISAPIRGFIRQMCSTWIFNVISLVKTYFEGKQLMNNIQVIHIYIHVKKKKWTWALNWLSLLFLHNCL